MTAFSKEALRRFERDRVDEVKRLNKLRAQARSMDPLELASVMSELDEEGARAHTELFAFYQSYLRALEELRQTQML
jgi:hypothetical protein